MRWLFSMVLPFAFCTPVYAQATKDPLAQCASIELALQRLMCYDSLAKSNDGGSAGPSSEAFGVPAAAVAAGARMIGNWLAKVETDPITDQKGATFILFAEGSTTVDNPSLVLGCMRGKVAVFVAPDEYLSDKNTGVIVRAAAEPALRGHWDLSSDGTALFFPNGRKGAEGFINALAGYDRLAIQVQPYQKGPKVMVFQLAGIKQVTQELWSICPPKSK